MGRKTQQGRRAGCVMGVEERRSINPVVSKGLTQVTSRQKLKEMRKQALWTPEGGERSKWRVQLVVGRLWGMPCPVCAQESRMASSTERGQ